MPDDPHFSDPSLDDPALGREKPTLFSLEVKRILVELAVVDATGREIATLTEEIGPNRARRS